MKFVTLLTLASGSLITNVLQADQWKTSFFESAVARHPHWAKQEAMKIANSQVGPLYQLCHEFGGAPSHTLEASGCQPTGAEDFRCYAKANISCELGTVSYVSGSELSGVYLDPIEGVFITITDNRTIAGNFVSPYGGGKILNQMEPLSRTGENTYETEANFSALEGRCIGRASVKLTKLSDGNLLLNISSRERISAIIFGSCKWSGGVTRYFELKRTNLLKK